VQQDAKHPRGHGFVKVVKAEGCSPQAKFDGSLLV